MTNLIDILDAAIFLIPLMAAAVFFATLAVRSIRRFA
jgi:hypothetical protein